MLLNANHIWVHGADVVNIGEDKGLGWVKAEGKNILDIVLTHLVGTFWTVQFNFLLVNVFLVISDLNDQGNIENSL